MDNLKGLKSLQHKIAIEKDKINKASLYAMANDMPVILRILQEHNIFVPKDFLGHGNKFYTKSKFLYWIQQVLKMDVTYESPTAVFLSAYNWQTEDDYGIGQNLDLAILRCALHFAYGTI